MTTTARVLLSLPLVVGAVLWMCHALRERRSIDVTRVSDDVRARYL